MQTLHIEQIADGIVTVYEEMCISIMPDGFFLK